MTMYDIVTLTILFIVALTFFVVFYATTKESCTTTDVSMKHSNNNQEGKRYYIRGRLDRSGAQLHTVIAGWMYCYKNNLVLVGSLKGRFMNDRKTLSKLLGVPPPIKNKKGLTKLNARVFKDILFDTKFTLPFLQHIRSKTNFQSVTNPERPFAVIHIRRGDVKKKGGAGSFRGYRRFTPFTYYANQIRQIRKRGIKNITICTEPSGVATFEDNHDILEGIVIETGSLEKAWNLMAQADILVCSKSSFSFVPALYNTNYVVYQPFWHEPLPSWHLSA